MLIVYLKHNNLLPGDFLAVKLRNKVSLHAGLFRTALVLSLSESTSPRDLFAWELNIYLGIRRKLFRCESISGRDIQTP